MVRHAIFSFINYISFKTRVYFVQSNFHAFLDRILSKIVNFDEYFYFIFNFYCNSIESSIATVKRNKYGAEGYREKNKGRVYTFNFIFDKLTSLHSTVRKAISVLNQISKRAMLDLESVLVQLTILLWDSLQRCPWKTKFLGMSSEGLFRILSDSISHLIYIVRTSCSRLPARSRIFCF